MKPWALLAIFVFLQSSQIVAQKYKYDPINQAFVNKDVNYLNSYLKEAEKNSGIGVTNHHHKSDIDTILSILVNNYTNSLMVKAKDGKLNYDENILIQPYVLCIEVDDIDVISINKNVRLEFDRNSLLSSSDDFFNFSNLSPIHRQVAVNVNYNSKSEYFKPLRLLKRNIYRLNSFLRGAMISKEKSSSSYKKRLAYFGNLIKRKITNYNFEGEVEEIFDYEIIIEKIAFNQLGNKALVQCIYPTGSRELYYEARNGRWEFITQWDLLTIN